MIETLARVAAELAVLAIREVHSSPPPLTLREPVRSSTPVLLALPERQLVLIKIDVNIGR